MSLVISLTCALLATLLQQWARRYLKITQSRYSPHKRARIRAFFVEGVEKCLLPWAVDALPTLLHISLFLFFAGLVVFLCNVDLTIFKLVLSWVSLCTALYGCITFMPIIRHDSPYYTPLSSPVWHIVTGTLFCIYRFLWWFNRSVYVRYHTAGRFRYLTRSCRKSLARGMLKAAEETALNSSSEIDARAFMWTFDCLDEDHELESFFSGLPGFRSSKVIKDPLPSLTEEEIQKLYWALDGLLDRTFSSDLLLAPVKDRRALICAKAVDPGLMSFNIDYKPAAFRILDLILFRYQHCGPVVTGIVKVLRGWENNIHEDKIVYVQSTIYTVLALNQPHDDSWYNFASDELGFSEISLREYATQGDNLSLVILIHIIRQQFSHFDKRSPPQKLNSLFVLSKASKFNVKDTSLKLQHEFCALWNRIVCEAQSRDDWDMAFYILGAIRNAFLALHQNTNSAPTQFSASTGDTNVILYQPSSYPLCKVLDHRTYSIPHIHDDGVSTTPAGAIPRDPNDTTFIPSITSPNRTPSTTHAPLPVTDALSPDNQLSVQGSIRPISQTTAEGRRVPATTCAASRSMEPSRTTQLSTSSPSLNLNTSACPPTDFAVGHSALSRAPSDDINARSSPYPTPILDAILPTDLLSFQAAARPDLSFSSPESHSSILATAAEGQGSMKAGMSVEQSASCSTSANRENITAGISPQLPPVADMADLLTRPLRTDHDAEHNVVGHTSSSDEVPSSSSPTPVLDDFLPNGALLLLGSSVAYLSPLFFARPSFSNACPRC